MPTNEAMHTWPPWRAGYHWPGNTGAYLVTLITEDGERYVELADYRGDGRWTLVGESRTVLVWPYAWMPLPPPSLGDELPTELSTCKGARKGTTGPE